MTSPLAAMDTPPCFEVESSDAVELSPPPLELAESQRTYVQSLSEMQKEAIVSNSRTSTVWRLASDEGPYLGGADVAPPPLAHFATGMVSSYMHRLHALADERGIDVDDVELVLDNRYGLQGSLLRGTMTGNALKPSLDVSLQADADEGTVRELVEAAITSTPAHGLLTGERDSLFSLSHNGREIEPDGVAELDGRPDDDPKATFAKLERPHHEQEAPIIRHTGRMTEPLPEGSERYTEKDAAGFADEQDRIIHVRVTCTKRSDGIKEVRQELFSPRGTVFEFASDEPDEHGGPTRAPPATTYLAAGLGFCFMTQIGRYAEAMNADLSDYRICQDSHLSSSDPETTESGAAKPIETQVFIDADEHEDVVRETLDMSEQTCFLHSVCRTDLTQEYGVEQL